MNLFEIQNKIDSILNEAIENEGELGENRLEELDIAQEELNDKLYAYAFVCDRFDSDIALLKSYKQSLDDRIKTCQKKKEKLKFIIGDVVKKYGEPVMKKGEPTGAISIKTPNITITVKPIFDVEYDQATVSTFLRECVDKLIFDNITKEELEKLNTFANIAIEYTFKPNKISDVIKKLREANITIPSEDIKINYTKTDLIKVLNNSPEGLDVWELIEKDSVTIRK